VLAIAVVVVFGSGKLFQERTRFIAYFPGSLQGLRVGAPVEMRGIQIGTVADIGIQVNDKLDFTFPVVMEVVSGQIRGITAHMKQAVNIKDLIAEGLRAQLVAQSLVTGQQSIQLDFYPDTPVNLAESTSPYEQVPTIPSSSEQIKGSIEQVVVQASELLDRVNDVLSEENRKKISDMIVKADGIVEDIRPTMEAFRHAAETADATLTDLGKDREEFAKLLEDGQQTLIAYKNLAERADGVIASNEDGIKQAIGGMVEIERRLGSLAGSTTGSSSMPSKFGTQSTVPCPNSCSRLFA